MNPCLFCRIVHGEVASAVIERGSAVTVFLDHRPVFPGHCLVVPNVHVETITDCPTSLLGPLFTEVARVARALERGLSAEGTFVAANNRISQSVPHLHVHVVPRRKKDGLKGFFWPRQKYESAEAMADVATAIRNALEPAPP